MMTRQILESLLTPIRSLIMKSRPAYKDYLGEETVEEKKELASGTMRENEYLGVQTNVPIVEGDTYFVVINGIERAVVARDGSFSNWGYPAITLTDEPENNEVLADWDSSSSSLLVCAGPYFLNRSVAIYHGNTLLAKCTMSTPWKEDSTSFCDQATLYDETFDGFVTGETYTLIVDNKDSLSGFVYNNLLYPDTIGTWHILYYPDEKYMEVFGPDSLSNASISVYQKVTTTKKNYDIKLLPDDLLPKTVARKTDVAKAVAKAETAQSTAETAQSTAETAQSTAETAQSTAETAQSTAKSLITTTTTTYTWPQTTTNLPYIRIGSDTYYKIGDLPNSFISGDSGKIIYGTSGGSVSSTPIDGTGCLAYQGTVIVVTTPGTCIVQLNVTPSTLYRFTASDSGVYSKALYLNQNIKEFVLTYKTLLKTVQNGDTSVTLRSSTANSTKRFKITVDDTGTLTVTEVTDT